MLRFKHAAVLGAFALLSCKEPTQITLELSTTGQCPKQPIDDARMVDAAIAAANEKLSGDQSDAFITTTSQCDDPPFIGSLVLVPAEERTGDRVDVLVVAGFETDDEKIAMNADACEKARAANATGIEGLNCVVVRRRLGFVDGLPITLPLEIQTACLGVECGEDLTCFNGGCVDPAVDCSTGRCPDPGGGGSGGSGAGGAGGAGAGGDGAGGSGGAPPVCSTETCAEPACANTLWCSDAVILNEASVRSAGEASEFIEVLNTGGTAIDLSNAAIVLLSGPSGETGEEYARIELGALDPLPPGGYLVVADSGLTPAPGSLATTFSFEGPSTAPEDHLRQGGALTAHAIALVVADELSSPIVRDAIVYDAGLVSFDLDGADVSAIPWGISDVEDALLPDSLARLPNGQTGAASDVVWNVTDIPTPGGENTAGELCNNGVDDMDADTDIDCADSDCAGQICGENGEVCVGAVQCACDDDGVEQSCGDAQDEDCDGAVDCADEDCAGVGSCPSENCFNGADDDGDSMSDCADADCNGMPCGANGRVCESGQCLCPNGSIETCNDGVDNDCDGAIDCADSGCAASALCTEICNNGVDDDSDGLVDCMDGTCDNVACNGMGDVCNTPMPCDCVPMGAELCSGGLDEDCDGLVDCFDSQCNLAFECNSEFCANLMDDNGNGLVDCQEPSCDGLQCDGNMNICVSGLCYCNPNGTELQCGDMVDNDCDGAMDCADADCDASCAENCMNLMDDDGDGFADCADSSCEGMSCGMGVVCTNGACMTALPINIMGFAPPVVSRTGNFTITGSGFSGVTGVHVGGVSQMFFVQNDGAINVTNLSTLTPIGTQSVIVFKPMAMGNSTLPVIDLVIQEINSVSSLPLQDYIELRTGGVDTVSLSGFTVVLYNEGGFVTNNFPLMGNASPTGTYRLGAGGPMVLGDLPTGPYAVALYQGAGPPLTVPVSANHPNLLDALPYGPPPAQAQLQPLLQMGSQVDENQAGNALMHTIQRCFPGRRNGMAFGVGPTGASPCVM